MIINLKEHKIFVSTPYSTSPEEEYTDILEVTEEGRIIFPQIPLAPSEVKKLIKAVNTAMIQVTIGRD